MKPLFASERFSVDSDAEALSDPSGAPDHFERELRCALPDALRFESAAVSGVGTEPLRLLRIERERDAMHVGAKYNMLIQTSKTADDLRYRSVPYPSRSRAYPYPEEETKL